MIQNGFFVLLLSFTGAFTEISSLQAGRGFKTSVLVNNGPDQNLMRKRGQDELYLGDSQGKS